MKKAMLLAGTATILSFNANAFDFKPYIGLDYVYSKVKYDDVPAIIDGIPVKIPSNYIKDKNNSFALNFGAKLLNNFGLELFYQQSDETEKNNAVGNLNGKVSAKFKAYGADAVGYLPIKEKIEGIAAVGVAKYDFKGKLGGDFYGSDNDDGLGLRLGFGAQYNFNEHIAARILARYVLTDNDWVKHISELSFGVRYNF